MLRLFLSLRLPPKTGPSKVNNDQSEREGWIFHMKVNTTYKVFKCICIPLQAAAISVHFKSSFRESRKGGREEATPTPEANINLLQAWSESIH